MYAYADHSKTEHPYLFRTYYSPPPLAESGRAWSGSGKNYGDAPNLPIWKVARATSAAPGYFRPIKIKTGRDPGDFIRFKDGGFGTNNPTKETYYDIVDKHGGQEKIGLVVSIGTGQTKIDKFAKKPGNMNNLIANIKAATKLPSRTLDAHEDMVRIADTNDKKLFPYYRFEGGESLGKLSLDEWKSHHFTKLSGHSNEKGYKTIKKIEDCIANYLKQPDVQSNLNACAKLLVRRRRLRTRNVSEWDRYASASYYDCVLTRCKAGRIKTIQEYKDHIKDWHGIPVPDSDLVQRMQSSRSGWIYRNKPAKSNPTAQHDDGSTSLLTEPALVSGPVNTTRGA